MKKGLVLNKSAITRMQAIAVVVVVIVAAVAGGIYYYLTLPKYPLAPESIKIGMIEPFTGAAGLVGMHFERGFIMAMDEINAKGGVYVKDYGKNIKLELIKADDKSVPAEGVTAAKKLIIDDKVNLIIGGHISGVGYANTPLSAEYKIPWIMPSAALKDITHRKDVDTSWIFRHQVLVDQSGYANMQILHEAVKPKLAPGRKLRVVIMYDDSVTGAMNTEAAMAAVGNFTGIEIVALVKFKTAAEALQPELLKAKEAKPDVIQIYSMNMATYATIVQQGLREVGLTCMFGNINPWEDQVLFDMMKEYGDGMIFDQFCSMFAPHSDRLRKWIDDYVKRWGVMPSPNSAKIYDTVYIAANAIERAGTLDKKAIRDALVTTDMPEILVSMKGHRIRFSGPNPPHDTTAYINIYWTQFRWNKEKQKMEGYVIWPSDLKQKDFAPSIWYKPMV